MTLTRFSESYRFNTGLNFISGMTRLILNDFDNTDGKERLLSALETVQFFDHLDKEDIIQKTLKIGENLPTDNKERLSEIVYKCFPNKHEYILTTLINSYSLQQIINVKLVKKFTK